MPKIFLMILMTFTCKTTEYLINIIESHSELWVGSRIIEFEPVELCIFL